MANMYLMSGPSGAGKTTFAKQYLKILEVQNHKEIQYLCIDDFYRVFNGSEKRHEDEFDVWITFFQAIHLAELKGRDVLIDTNAPTISKRTEFLDWFPSFEHHLIYIEADSELCIANNARRNRVIPTNEMQQILSSMEHPSFSELGRWKTIQIWKNDNNKRYVSIDQHKVLGSDYVSNQQQIRKERNGMNKFEIVSREEYEKNMIDFSPRNGIVSYLLYDELKLPKRGTKGSAGYDFFSPISFKLKAGETIKIPTGIKCKLDEGRVLLLFPRSSLGFKYRLQLDNTVGVMDQDYYNNINNEGHIFVKITNDNKQGKALEIKRGDAFAQGIIIRYELAEEDEVTTSRVGGFGSTSNS